MNKEGDLRVRISQKLREAIYKEAQNRGMNISEFVRYVMRKEVER